MDKIIENEIFRFIALRPPMPAEPEDTELSFIKDPRTPINQTTVGKFAASLYDINPNAIADRVKNFNLNYDAATLERDESFQQLLAAYDAAYALTSNSVSSLNSVITQALGRTAKEFLARQETLNLNLRDMIWDVYYLTYIRSRYSDQNLELLTKGLRAYHLLTFVADGKINQFKSLEKILDATPQIDKLFTDIPRPPLKPLPKETATSAAAIRDYKALWNKLIDTNRAITEVGKLSFDITETAKIADGNSGATTGQSFTFNDNSREGSKSAIINSSQLDSIKTALANSGITIGNSQLEAISSALAAGSDSDTTIIRSLVSVNKESFKKLHSRTKALLKAQGINESNVSVSTTMNTLQNQMSDLFLEISLQNDPAFLSLMPTAAKSIAGIRPVVDSLSKRLSTLKKPVVGEKSALEPLGVADLKVVKMRLKKYMPGEIARIENVLKGENKVRDSRVLERSETIFTSSLEQTEEQKNESQSTERLQIKSEAEKTVEQMYKVDAGTKVTAKYGAVSVEASGSFGWQKTSKDVAKSSSDHAREVIDKSVTSISKKVKEERTTKNLRETEEKNIHTLNNSSGTSHTVGIYRWVDMLYEARICNYGKRLMMQFMIPEPSTYYEYAKEKYGDYLKSAAMDDLECPEAFTLRSPKEITESNYLTFIRKYNVEGISPPPPLYRTVSVGLRKRINTDVHGDVDENNTDKLQIPTGYKVEKLDGNLTYNFTYLQKHGEPQHCAVMVCVGNEKIVSIRGKEDGRQMDSKEKQDINQYREGTQGSAGTEGSEGTEGNIIPISVNTRDIETYTLNVEMRCTRTDYALLKWRIDTYKAIQKAYLAMKLIYEQKLAEKKELAEQRAGTSGVITGLNPGLNRDIERTELKKQCIRILMENCQGQSFGAFDANSGQATGDFDIMDAIKEGDYIQFFEQAFEWENMTYIYYPYFWASKNKWDMKSMTYDDDSQFTKFLQAGAARVMLPARKNYEEVVAYYLKTGFIWKGGTAPVANDPLYISVAEELKNQTDGSDDGEASEPWEVVVPTTQIYLQQDETPLPVFEE